MRVLRSKVFMEVVVTVVRLHLILAVLYVGASDTVRVLRCVMPVVIESVVGRSEAGLLRVDNHPGLHRNRLPRAQGRNIMSIVP